MREDQSILNRDEESHRTNTKRAWTFVEVLGLLCPILLFWRIWTFCQNSRKGCRYKRPGQEYEPVNDDLDTQTKLQEANKRLNTQTDENAVLQNRIDELQSENREMKHALEERDNKIVKLEQEKEILEKEKEDALNRLVEEKDNEIGKLQNEKAILEKEKEDALNRVSQLVSVKLRDNNPNIVDLSDHYRPTKLAEIFSELYDNEWTAAYTFLEDKFEPEQIDSFLLDIVMESYTFCNEKAESSWSYVTQWFLPKGAHNAQTVRKSLKEGQKLQAPTLVSQLGEEFCDHIKTKCSVEQLRSVLDNKELAEYVHLCVKVCFLMAVNDPPVIIECPNRGKPDIKFNREEFKEYTTRGPFLAFYVWPLIRLHAGGPLLSKGVAQGANDPATRVAWTWST
ncbi:uncharacterized protein LOC128226515 [Mya arenaria]|uniref:uncharacterized protein LOC128226515 n=1 Tax=Mya arenaria TaxID=6604 RepID=UPI0022E85C2E|nr:uncharacterized protein LOC128226515 [Mya arenaria]XP_052792384.1 uncharacterized protein LOC128226515 [Mya arenaria]